jgi:hypothetical protein
MAKIKFISNRAYLTDTGPSTPLPVIKTLPDWYTDADRFAKMPNGDHYIGPDKGKIPTWKSCPALYDIMGSGYVERTPCDIEFYINDSGIISVNFADEKYKDFVHIRPPMPQFQVPFGYHNHHFAWWSEWGVQVPKGYSVLYSQPFNRFELPFLTTSGIIDNDKVNMPGTVPFFIAKDWTGVIPAGTPYMQLFPFKREDWESEIEIEKPSNIYQKNVELSMKYRKPNGGVYQREVWQRRKYE